MLSISKASGTTPGALTCTQFHLGHSHGRRYVCVVPSLACTELVTKVWEGTQGAGCDLEIRKLLLLPGWRGRAGQGTRQRKGSCQYPGLGPQPEVSPMLLDPGPLPPQSHLQECKGFYLLICCQGLSSADSSWKSPSKGAWDP